ncbi:type I-E CRISPR-associated protein Cse1/CasA [Serratia rubidaea]|uniref:type I-E CRISPR-associated protein Cse1/CasA n=1 Tax=Serratia rubidaea TaxID=61652 RepID=UPI003FA364D6
MFSLCTEFWLPVIDRMGQRRKISPQQIFDSDIVELAWPRADFQGAAYQLLIGLLQTTLSPKDEEEWDDVWEEGVDVQRWHQALDRVAAAFHFGPQKPAFLQDFSTLEVESSSVAGLLVDAPGGNTLKLNKDHFVKRSSYQQFCPHCTVMALFTVQTNSPAAGAGFRTSMRGGGPMTTLLVPKTPGEPLWKKLWLNVMPQSDSWQKEQLPLIFPWLTTTRSSETAKNIVTPGNSHPLQAYWGMPRRLEVDFDQTRAGQCDLCGEHSDALLSQMRSKNYGVQYEGWRHPLSPYRQALKDLEAPLIPLKGQPGGLAYKDWLGLVVESEEKLNRVLPARVVRLNPMPKLTHLWCFGYDMDNAKARCWYEHRLAISSLPKSQGGELKALLQMAIELAASSLPLLRQALKEAWFSSPKDAKGDFSAIDVAFWQQTEADFSRLWNTLNHYPSATYPEAREALRLWNTALWDYLFLAFDLRAFTNPDESADLARILRARLHLNKNFIKQKSVKALAEIGVSVGRSKMFDMDTAKPMIVTEPAAAKALRRWFDFLQERNNQHQGVAVNGRAWRAELRRSEQPFGALTTAAFHSLNQSLAEHLQFQPSDKLALAIVAHVVSHAHADSNKASFPRQLGEQIKGNACLSRLRFDRLLAVKTPAELCSQLTRAVKLRGDNGINIVSLADGVFLWMREWQQREQNLPAQSNPFKRFDVRWTSEYLLATEK